MRDRPTPETDAVWADKSKNILEHARRLERERDEARQKMADALQEVDLRTIDYERMKETLRFILNECDWERLGGNLGGGDERIGKSIRAILNKDEN